MWTCELNKAFPPQLALSWCFVMAIATLTQTVGDKCVWVQISERPEKKNPLKRKPRLVCRVQWSAMQPSQLFSLKEFALMGTGCYMGSEVLNCVLLDKKSMYQPQDHHICGFWELLLCLLSQNATWFLVLDLWDFCLKFVSYIKIT